MSKLPIDTLIIVNCYTFVLLVDYYYVCMYTVVSIAIIPWVSRNISFL